MKHLFQAFGGIFLAGSLTVSAQQSAGLQYGEAVRAFQRGDSATVVTILEPVVHSAELKGIELGRVWLLLGASYRAVGRYHSAELAYGDATLLLKDDPLAVKDNEVLLRESGDFYREMGDFASAERLENKGLQLSEEIQDHTAIARACQGLAELFLDRGELRKGERFVSRAVDEVRLTSEFDEDDRAYLAQL